MCVCFYTAGRWKWLDEQCALSLHLCQCVVNVPTNIDTNKLKLETYSLFKVNHFSIKNVLIPIWYFHFKS